MRSDVFFYVRQGWNWIVQMFVWIAGVRNNPNIRFTKKCIEMAGMSLSFESWWPIRWPGRILGGPDQIPSTECKCTEWFVQFFQEKHALKLSGQSRPVESKSRWPGGQIRWPRANGPVLPTSLNMVRKNPALINSTSFSLFLTKCMCRLFEPLDP